MAMEDFEKVSKKAKTLRIIKLTVIYTLLSFWAIMILFPFYFLEFIIVIINSAFTFISLVIKCFKY